MIIFAFSILVVFSGIQFHLVFAFSTEVSEWFSRFFHLGLDDSERERESFFPDCTNVSVGENARF